MSLQISLAPQDAAHARVILPHQLRQWGAQVEEVVFTLDLGPGETLGSAQQRAQIDSLLDELCGDNPHARIAHVDYGPAAIREVSQRFFAGRAVPRKDCYGKVVYPYFYGLFCARNRYVLHTDSDMMFGGGSQIWTAEAVALLSDSTDVFSCSPLPGPPTDRPLPISVARGHAGSRSRRALRANAAPVRADGLEGPALRFSRISTRDFMVDRSAVIDGTNAIRARGPSLRNLAATIANGTIVRGDPRYAPAETWLTRAMGALGMHRVDFLGRLPGMWSIHPAVRSEAFHRLLPELVRRIEAGRVPEGQCGDYDLNEAMFERASGVDA